MIKTLNQNPSGFKELMHLKHQMTIQCAPIINKMISSTGVDATIVIFMVIVSTPATTTALILMHASGLLQT